MEKDKDTQVDSKAIIKKQDVKSITTRNFKAAQSTLRYLTLPRISPFLTPITLIEREAKNSEKIEKDHINFLKKKRMSTGVYPYFYSSEK